jgi:hypothetical protein
MTDVWPSTIPQTPLIDQWIGGPQRNKVSFKPDVGPTIDRRRTSSALSIFTATFPPMTELQFATFETFFETTLKDGILPFDWADPVTGVTRRWKFADDDPPYQATAGAGDLITVSTKFIRLT